MSKLNTLRALPKLPPTIFGNQPFKALYIIYSISTTLLLLPIWSILHFTPLKTFPSIWTLRETIQIRSMRKLSYILSKCDIPLFMRSSNKLPPKGSLKQSRAFFIEPCDNKWIKGILKSDSVGSVRIPAYIYGKNSPEKGEGGLKLDKDEKVVMVLHGGGLSIGSSHEKDLTANIPKEIVKRCKNIHQVISIEYRLVHQSPFPAQLIDALSGYIYLIETLQISPQNIILTGDSAGANLVLGLTRYLRDNGFENYLPRGLFLLSPWCDMTNDIMPKSLMHRPLNMTVDYLNFAALQPWISHRLLLNNPISTIDSPYLSPAADVVPSNVELFKGFPQTLITSGEKESLIEQIRELVKRFELGGVNVVYDEQENAVHDYMILDWFQPQMVERAWVKSTLWLDSLF